MITLWTKEEISILKDMAEKGATLQDLCNVLQGRSLEGIRSQIQRLKIKLQSHPVINHSAYQEFLQSIKGQKVKRA